MARILVYTSPARGHLYPIIPTLEALRTRGHEVAVRTLSSEVARTSSLGFDAKPISAAVEAREIDDWKAKTPLGALAAACRTFVDRGHLEIADLRSAIDAEEPDLLFTDVNSWGAAAAAETSGLPWAVFSPYFLPVQALGIPPWGLGLNPTQGALGNLRDAIGWRLVNALYDRVLPDLNRLRAEAGAAPYRHVSDYVRVPPRLVYYTAEPFEYPRDWPNNIRMVGPGIWEPAGDDMAEPGDDRPLVLVTCSTEFQNDAKIIETALAALADEPVRVVATTASIDPTRFEAPANARVERFLPHGPLLREAACVVCHGGMGITQKALSWGVPLCVVPVGRDQLEVARHVAVAEAGVRVPVQRLSPARLRAAVRRAMLMRDGAARVAAAFRAAGGPLAAADAVEELLESNPHGVTYSSASGPVAA